MFIKVQVSLKAPVSKLLILLKPGDVIYGFFPVLNGV